MNRITGQVPDYNLVVILIHIAVAGSKLRSSHCLCIWPAGNNGGQVGDLGLEHQRLDYQASFANSRRRRRRIIEGEYAPDLVGAACGVRGPAIVRRGRWGLNP